MTKLNQFAGDDKPRALVVFMTRYAFYAAVIAILLMIFALIVKLMCNCGGDQSARQSESSASLLLAKDDQNVVGLEESGNNNSSSSSDDDWYDGKICVICCDELRNCFFIPCGHCVSCLNCAHRIKNDTCPVCRGIIDKVRKLHIF